MEKIERKQAVDSGEKKRGFLAINSLGELLPVICIIFFFAYLIGNEPIVDSLAVNNQITTEKFSEAKVIDEQKKLEKTNKKEENSYLNTSPTKNKAKTLPRTETSNKNQLIQKENPIKEEEDLARPLFPKTSPRKVLPTIEVSQPIENITPTVEKYSGMERISPKETILARISTENIIPTSIPAVKEEQVERLKEKAITHLAGIELETPEMIVKPNWTPRKEIIEEPIVEDVEVKIENKKTVVSDVLTNYNSSDFKWSVNNHNHGIKKSAIFTNTPDGKASYSCTDAGIILRVNNLNNIHADYGIFVEKSEDGIEYNSIGVINPENASGLMYFDAEYSFDGQHHYRFRSTSPEGNELEFGKVSVIRRASISPILSMVNASGQYNLVLNSNSRQTVDFEIKEAWGSLNGENGRKHLVEGENELSFDLTGDPGLYFLKMSTGNQTLELLLEKPGISPDLSFYDQEVSGKQSFNDYGPIPFLFKKPKTLNFDFYLKNGNTLIFNKGEYNSETVKIKKAKIGALPETLQGRHSEEMLWFTASSNISYLHQKVPVILEHNNQEIAAQINIFASNNTVRPISHFSPDNDGIQDEWRIPGIENCPNIDLMVFNDWGNFIYQTENVTEENIWNGQKNGKNLPEGMYYYVLGQYGGWVQLER